MPKIAIPVHKQARYSEQGQTYSQYKPEDLKGQAPQRSEMKRVHGPHDPVAESLVPAVVPDSKDAGVSGGDGDDVAMGEVPGSAEIHLRVDDGAGKRRITDAEDAAVW